MGGVGIIKGKRLVLTNDLGYNVLELGPDEFGNGNLSISSMKGRRGIHLLGLGSGFWIQGFNENNVVAVQTGIRVGAWPPPSEYS